MVILKGENKSELLNEFGKRIQQNHPMKETKEFPVGWCSWYWVGPNISERKIFKALKVIKEKTPEMKFIQIDDGFQPHMGDWLEVSRKFKHPMKKICNDIKAEGFEPAIWLAPFIASPKSRLFKEHPEYFVKDENGKPLCSDKVTFPGWRDAPWYMLDGTHPGTREYIYKVVKTIYEEWNVKYFKLDANNWGALPFGVRYDNTKTSVEAYRMMMETIFEASNNDAFILGCNAPMWPSLGLVTGMRVTNDTFRDTPTFAQIAKECFYRNWMNNQLWLNDPDCLLIADAKPKIMNPAGKKAEATRKSKGEMYKLNAIYIRASGGSILSGDPVKAYGEKEVEVFKKLISLPKIAAEFDNNYETGVIKYDNTTEYCIFNFSDSEKTYTINVPKNAEVIDMYNNLKLNAVNGSISIPLEANAAAWISVSASTLLG